ncbi:BRO-N domain-containing protein [Vibrio cholerae]
MSEVIRAFEKVLTFDLGGQELRTAVLENGDPLFCGKDACAMLSIAKYNNALNRLDEEERVTLTAGTLGGAQAMTFITEAGLYRLIFMSRKEEARKFQAWVFKEVLPQIRRTGTFSLDGRTSLSARKQYIDLVKLIAKSKSNFEKEVLQHALTDVSRQLGYPCTKAKVSNDKANS